MKRVCVLYAMTVWSWAGVGHFMARALKEPDDLSRYTWLVVMLAVSGCLTGASLLAFFLPTYKVAFRAGFQAGSRSAESQAHRPVLTVVAGGNSTGEVVPMRMHTQN